VGWRVTECFRFKKFFERIEIKFIKLSKALHPDDGGSQCVGIDFAVLYSPALFLNDKARTRKNGQMLLNGRKRHLERFRHLGDGLVRFQQERKYLASRRIRKGGKQFIEAGTHPCHHAV